MSLAYMLAKEKAVAQGTDIPNPIEFVKVRCTMEEKRTKQSEADACDINKIMDKYINTGRLPEYIKTNPQYGNFADVEDFQTSLETVRKAEEQFAMLPSKVREMCQNDPAKFLEFVSNPDNRDMLVEMRLAKPKLEKGDELIGQAAAKLAEGVSGALASMSKTKGDLAKGKTTQPS